MGTTIGKKIRERRKELKMTQSDLAGSEMTKSMLSHIETGHSNPSMKNLEYIARKLDMSIAYLLENDVTDHRKQKEEQLPIDIILSDLSDIDELIKEKAYELAEKDLEKLLNLYTFNEKSKMYADVINRLGFCKLKIQKVEEGRKLIEKCSSIYISNMLYVDAARANINLLKLGIENYDYKGSLEIVDKIYEIYNKSSTKDIFLEIEMLVMQPAIHFALGNYEKTIEVCKKAISLSRDNNLYYRLDDAYRILAITYMLQDDFSNFELNSNEARKYVEFTGNKLNLAKIYHNYAKCENQKGNPVEAIKYLNLLVDNAGDKTFYYYIEYAKAQYLMGNYNEALEALMGINYEENPKYQMDCIYMITAKVYKGLCYCKLYELEKAISEIEEAIKEIEEYINTGYKGFELYAQKELSFAYSSLSEVYSLKGDYENAYILLKKSNKASKGH